MTDRDLDGKTALVTGGSRGIGKAISLSLAQRGANVVIAYLRKSGPAQEACAEIEGHGVKAVSARCNVGDVASIDTLFRHIDDVFGQLDIFISNAATGVIRPIEQLDEKAWAWTVDANARALLLCARSARALMPEGSSIVALSSLGSTRVLPGYAAVGASKAAIECLVRYLAVELAPAIRVNTVSPGVVDTDALKHFPMREEMLATAAEKTPMDRLVSPSDVARVVDFLTSRDAEMITGQCVTVDGGASLLA